MASVFESGVHVASCSACSLASGRGLGSVFLIRSSQCPGAGGVDITSKRDGLVVACGNVYCSSALLRDQEGPLTYSSFGRIHHISGSCRQHRRPSIAIQQQSCRGCWLASCRTESQYHLSKSGQRTYVALVAICRVSFIDGRTRT